MMSAISRKLAVLLILPFAIGLPGSSFATETRQVREAKDRAPAQASNRIPDGKGGALEAPPWAPRASSSNLLVNGISYYGGPLINTPSGVNVYYIWYGNWSGNSATTILRDFVSNLTGSPYYNINTTYYDKSNQRVANRVNYQAAINDSYSQGHTLTDGGVASVVQSAINSSLPLDANAVYFVLTSADVAESSGFCTSYCGWHSYNTMTKAGASATIKYSFVGNPDKCPSACSAQSTGPNANAGADGMASIIAHELEEAVTDPVFNGWYDSRGYENADKCAWSFGSLSTASNGSKYNVTLGGKNYLIQQNWLNANGGRCTMSY